VYVKLRNHIFRVRLISRGRLGLLLGRRREMEMEMEMELDYMMFLMYFIIRLRVLRSSRSDCLYSRLYFFVDRSDDG
jgi:hypothetical protein